MKIFKSVSGRIRTAASRHEPEGVRVLSDMYWRIVVVLAAILIVVSIGYGVWSLLRVLEGLSSAVMVSSPPPPPINRRVLDAAIQGFESREVYFEDRNASSTQSIADPSI